MSDHDNSPLNWPIHPRKGYCGSDFQLLILGLKAKKFLEMLTLASFNKERFWYLNLLNGILDLRDSNRVKQNSFKKNKKLWLLRVDKWTLLKLPLSTTQSLNQVYIVQYCLICIYLFSDFFCKGNPSSKINIFCYFNSFFQTHLMSIKRCIKQCLLVYILRGNCSKGKLLI